jgi:hypothetical protein
MKPTGRDRMIGRLAGLYAQHGVTFDPASWSLSQSYYFGRVHGAAPPLVEIVGDQCVDRLDELDAIAVRKPNGIHGNGTTGPTDEQALIDAIVSGANYHQASMSLLGRWASAGIGMVEAKERLVTAFECVFPADRDQRWRDRFANIPRQLEYVYGKEAKKRDERIEFTIGSSAAADSPADDAEEEVADDDTAAEDDEIRRLVSLGDWTTRTIALPDPLLGYLLTTVSRMMLVAPTGIGKTNFALAIAFAVASGKAFLGWAGSGTPRRVLYVDGEMPEQLMRERLEDAIRRAGDMPEGLFVLSRENFPDMPPLNTPAGRGFIDRVIKLIGGVDLVVFDNIQALVDGDMKEELPWKMVLPWIRELTRRKISQIWVHHTGHDETHSYGTKTREWQLDLVAMLESIERPDADLAFMLKFTKARGKTPSNRADFEPIVVTLAGDRWASERGAAAGSRKGSSSDMALAVLRDEIARGNGTIPPSNEHIPPNKLCITREAWQRAYLLRSLHESAEAAVRAFQRAAKKLVEDHKAVAKYDLWVWPVR